MYVLHYAPDNASLIIRLALDHCAVPYLAQLVDRARQAQRSPAYLRLNPNGLIPALETQEGTIFETGAILLWLSERHKGLAPSARDAARGDFLKWFMFTANTVHPAMRMLFYPEKYVGADASAQVALATCLKRDLTKHFALLDKVAADAPAWFGGSSPSSLDFYVAAVLRWCALYPTNRDRSWFDLSRYPALLELTRRLEELPCTHLLQQAEGLGETPFSAPKYPNPPEGSAT